MPFNIITALAADPGPTTAAAFLARHQISQPTLWRHAREAGDAVAQWRHGRATMLAATRAPGATPVWAIDSTGTPHQLSPIFLLRAGGSVWLDWEGRTKRFEGLPPDVLHARPQGFLGRSLARNLARTTGLPDNPDRWSDDQVLQVLQWRGSDLPGQLLIVQASFDAWAEQRDLAPSIEQENLHAELPGLAEYALSDAQNMGSSAAGEQPKFLACILGNGEIRHVLVKFSPPMDTAAGIRWADLLAAEHLAANALRAHDIPASKTQIVDSHGRRFLVADRFDRIGAVGRRGLISLGAIDDEHFGARSTPWLSASYRLENAGMLSSDDAKALRMIYAFGTLIANTDMHYGNVSLTHSWVPFGPMREHMHAPQRMGLAPVYDMLPMAYAPQRSEVRRTWHQTPGWIQGLGASDFTSAEQWAAEFWESCAVSGMISEDFRAVARHHQSEIQALGTKHADGQAQPNAHRAIAPRG